MKANKIAKISLISGAVLTVLYVGAVIAYAALVPQEATPAAQVTQAREDITPAMLYNLTNEERNKAGAPLLTLNPALNTSAQQKCDDMVQNNYYAHERPSDGKKGTDYIFANVKVNGGYGAENLNNGNLLTARAYIDNWLNSPAHKAAMLDPKYNNVGFAVCHLPNDPADNRALVMHLAEIKPEPVKPQVQYVKPQSTYTPPRTTHCSSYESMGIIHTNCY